MLNNFLRIQPSPAFWTHSCHIRTGHFQERLLKRPKARMLCRENPLGLESGSSGLLTHRMFRKRCIVNRCSTLSSSNIAREAGRESHEEKRTSGAEKSSDACRTAGHADSGHAPFFGVPDLKSTICNMFTLAYALCSR
jgi:hypothetical protein